MHDQSRKILLTGYADDLAEIVPRIASRSADIALVNENASGTDVPKAAGVVVFVMSLNACYSTQLHSVFVYVYDRVHAGERYLLAVGDVDLSKFAFPEIVHLPRITIGELESLLQSSP